MITTIDFVKSNLSIRKSSFTDCASVYNTIMLDPNLSIKSIDNKMLQKISSKSFVTSQLTSNITNKSNRLEGLDCMLNGINFLTGVIFKNYSKVIQYKYFFISLYILAGQVFSDGNHRVVLEYLQTLGFDQIKSTKILNTIDSIRRRTNLDWDSIHGFIQNLIDNIVLIKGEIDLVKELDLLTI